MILPALLLAFQTAPAEAPSRAVEDDEIVWVSGGEGRFWIEAVIEVTPTPAVQTALERRGLDAVCEALADMRHRLQARYFHGYRTALVAAFREVPAETLERAVEAGPSLADRTIGLGAYARHLAQASDAGHPAVASASAELASVIAKWDARPLPPAVSGRLRPAALAANRQNHALLNLWCATPKASRDQMIDFFVKEPN